MSSSNCLDLLIPNGILKNQPGGIIYQEPKMSKSFPIRFIPIVMLKILILFGAMVVSQLQNWSIIWKLTISLRHSAQIVQGEIFIVVVT